MTADGRGRLELQSNAGDTQVGWTRSDVTVFDASSNTVYHAALPAEKRDVAQERNARPTLADIQKILSELGAHATVSAAHPTNVAGQPAYTLSVAPKNSGGLLRSLQAAWDASRGVPLRLAVYAKGVSAPVLELKATHISYGPVSSGDVAVSPPAGARTVELGASTGRHEPRVRGPEAVVVAPSTLAGLPRTGVRRARWGTVVLYGKDLGSIVVLEHAADSSGDGHDLLSSLPAISLPGTKGHELATSLGTVIEWRRHGVDYIVAGSVPTSVAEAAARSLR